MRQKRHSGSSNNNRNRGRGKYRGGGGGGDSQSLARQKKHASTQKEKYLNLARDAQVNGERVDAEYYYQHVEHYSRTLAEIEAKEPKPEKREAANDDAKDDNADSDDSQQAESGEQDEEAAVEAKPKQTRGGGRRRQPKAQAEEIPLPSSVIPEAEPEPKAASGQ